MFACVYCFSVMAGVGGRHHPYAPLLTLQEQSILPFPAQLYWSKVVWNLGRRDKFVEAHADCAGDTVNHIYQYVKKWVGKRSTFCQIWKQVIVLHPTDSVGNVVDERGWQLLAVASHLVLPGEPSDIASAGYKSKMIDLSKEGRSKFIIPGVVVRKFINNPDFADMQRIVFTFLVLMNVRVVRGKLENLEKGITIA